MHNLDDASWKYRKDAIEIWEAQAENSQEQKSIRGVLERNANATFGRNCYIAPDCNFFTHRATLANNVRIGSLVTLRGNLTFGNDVTVNPMTNIIGNVSIGDAVRIASGVQIFGFNHGYSRVDRYIKDQPISSSGITIGNGTWIGAGVSIVDGVSLGANSVVAAGAVVTKSFPEFSIIGGVPAKLLKNRLDGNGRKLVVTERNTKQHGIKVHLEVPVTGYLDNQKPSINGWIAFKTDVKDIFVKTATREHRIECTEDRPDVVDFLNRTDSELAGARVFSFRIPILANDVVLNTNIGKKSVELVRLACKENTN
tara:strand:- start:23683 stop:24618 length:936 start_codon:yes stop_codon:yes gene_type:complete